ncbi:MAG: homocysteine S-methyltransferase family protein [Clostridia bacterium]|nr:homocysteine S-methyltransferase family protein [Clostridia bacterium]
MNILERIKNNRLYLDGGMGSFVVSLGFETSEMEQLSITNPELIKKIHEKYFQAGTNACLTNTFGCSKKENFGKYSLEEIITSAVKNAREVADKYNGYVIYDCGPIGQLLYPYGRLSFFEAYDIFKKQAEIVNTIDEIDAVIIETISDLQEMRAAVLAFKENTQKIVFSSMTFEKDGRTFSGSLCEAYALTMDALGVDVIGVNCGVGPKETIETIKRISSVTNKPIFAKPNATIPRLENGKTIYDITAKEFSLYMKELAKYCNVLGGCCGTNDEFIKETVKETINVKSQRINFNVDAICSYSTVIDFNTNNKTLVIGERVNPTNKPLLKQAIIDDNNDYILSMCVDQEERGADLLDINLGMPGINEEEKLKNTVSYIQGVVHAPLVIDSSDKKALETAVRVHNGICIINSVNGEAESMEKVFAIAKKYGSYIIALCLDESGIPETCDGRIEIAKKIIKKAEEFRIDKKKLIFDPLTMAVSVNSQNGLITLETINRLQKELNVKTTLGLSNISFGLPNRVNINSTFYKMVIDNNVTCAIINPSLTPKEDVYSKELLLGKDKNCENYISHNQEKVALVEKVIDKDLSYFICHGLTNEGLDVIKITANKENVNEIINNEIIGALNKLGKEYESGKIFLPQLIAGSETAKAILDYLKSTYISRDGLSKNKAIVLLATVKGDVHDIGKNIVKAVIGNYGYKIYDLGKDTPTEIIIEAIEKYHPQAIGLSALMTTTLVNMTDTIRVIKDKYKDIVIIVGGAVVTRQYADSLNVIYTKDAQEAARVLEDIFAK